MSLAALAGRIRHSHILISTCRLGWCICISGPYLKGAQSWMTARGTTSKAASPAGPPTSNAQSSTWTSVSGLAHLSEQLSAKSLSMSASAGLIPSNSNAARNPKEPIVLKHHQISMEPYSGNPFVNQEIVSPDQRIGVRFYAQAMGIDFKSALYQEMLFSCALTGKPSRKEAFGEYRWDCCVIGNQEDYVKTNQHGEWIGALEPLGSEEPVWWPHDPCTCEQHRLRTRVCVSRSFLGIHLASSVPQLHSSRRRL